MQRDRFIILHDSHPDANPLSRKTFRQTSMINQRFVPTLAALLPVFRSSISSSRSFRGSSSNALTLDLVILSSFWSRSLRAESISAFLSRVSWIFPRYASFLRQANLMSSSLIFCRPESCADRWPSKQVSVIKSVRSSSSTRFVLSRECCESP